MQLSFIYENKEICFRVLFRQRKSLCIKVDEDGLIKVYAPPGYSEELILKKVQAKANWIINAQGYFSSKKLQKQPWQEGKVLLYMGCEYPLHLEIVPGVSAEVILRPDKLIVRMFKYDALMLSQIVENWFRQRAREKILERIAVYEERIARVPGRITIKSQKTRWGSCSAKGNLNFNWRIIMAPEKIIDYIVVHELCHLIELNHSRSFWGLVEQILPDYKESKQWLKENQSRMMNW